jgi:transposase-like protein
VHLSKAWGTNPDSRGALMAAETPKLCKRCKQEMVKVTWIGPLSKGERGLIVWRCENCGSTDTDLVYPSGRRNEDQGPSAR